MRTVIGCLVAGSLVLPASGLAQRVPDPGELVRITQTDGTVLTGFFARSSTEHLVLLGAWREQEYVIPRTDIDTIERSLGRHRQFGKNFGITLAVASLSIGAISAFTWSPCRDTGFLACLFHPTSRGEAFTWGFVGGAALGLPIGLVVGLAVRQERWARVSVPGLGESVLSIKPVLGPRTGFSASISLGGR